MLNYEQHCETLQGNGDTASHILKLEVSGWLIPPNTLLLE